MAPETFFAQLWDNHVTIAPAALSIRRTVQKWYGPVQNDHVAFRTFDLSPMRLQDLERAFLGWGYSRSGSYEFPDKHLRAYGYVPKDSALPLVFLSELLTKELPESCQAVIHGELLSRARFASSPTDKLLQGRPWPMPTWEQYRTLEAVSPYAAWLSVWGLCANHFTIAVHHLAGAPALREVVQVLMDANYPMNDAGGVLQGGPDQLLEQASTLAETRSVRFAGGDERQVPSCYYELAHRYPQADGQLYMGFVAASANNIFESTTERKEAPTAHHLAIRRRKDQP